MEHLQAQLPEVETTLAVRVLYMLMDMRDTNPPAFATFMEKRWRAIPAVDRQTAQNDPRLGIVHNAEQTAAFWRGYIIDDIVDHLPPEPRSAPSVEQIVTAA